jgi:hypothetical protein
MRILKTVCLAAAFAFGASATYAVNLPAEDASGVVLHSTLGSVTGENSGISAPVGEVQAGETFMITGECVSRVQSEDNLRVVLTFADNSSGAGYRSMVATDQQIQSDGLSVRVPDLPEAANQIFSVRVFRLGKDVPEMCNAGSIWIVGATQGKLG